MEYITHITKVYEHLEANSVANAVIECLKMARLNRDYLHIAIFVRELCGGKHEGARVFLDDTEEITENAAKYFWEKSYDSWLSVHDLGYTILQGAEHKDKTIVALSIAEIENEIENRNAWISDRAIQPTLIDGSTAESIHLVRMRLMALGAIRQRVKIKCFNYVSRLEKELSSAKKSRHFLSTIHSEVDNYFKARSEDVYTKLQSASQLIDSNDAESHSLLLTQVRRAIKAAADHFYPPSSQSVECSDGQWRVLNDERYLNRLTEFMVRTFGESSAGELLVAEVKFLAAFAKRLNEVASKGVHSDVSLDEAKQGILGLYMLLYNVITKLQKRQRLPETS